MKIITDEEAFAVKSFEKRIPLRREGYNFEFTRRWFLHRNLTTWSTFLPDRFPFGSVKMVQIGVFEGMDLIWCLQNILCDARSKVWAIDPWLPTTKLNADTMEAVCNRAQKNLSYWKEKVKIRRGLSAEILPSLTTGQFDLVVIDGDHNTDPVYFDALQAFRLLKPGGWMIFDDVRNRLPKKDHVVDGMRRFVDEHEGKVKLEWQHRYCDCYSKL